MEKMISYPKCSLGSKSYITSKSNFSNFKVYREMSYFRYIVFFSKFWNLNPWASWLRILKQKHRLIQSTLLMPKTSQLDLSCHLLNAISRQRLIRRFLGGWKFMTHISNIWQLFTFVISIANIVVTSFYDESFIREKRMCKQHRARAKEGGWGGKEGGAGREEGKCHDALDPHRHPKMRSGDGEA